MARVIGVVGYECEDITVFLAKILSSLGKKTAIADRSEQELLCVILEMNVNKRESVKIREYENIYITNQNVCTEEFDVIFYVFGYRLGHPKIFECEDILMITDGVPAHATLLKPIVSLECRRYLFIRNLIGLNHSVKYLQELLDDRTSYAVIPYDEGDIRQRCNLSPYGGAHIKLLSTGMRKALIEWICYMFEEYQDKEIWKVMKKL